MVKHVKLKHISSLNCAQIYKIPWIFQKMLLQMGNFEETNYINILMQK
jgi:hypothetical protein